MFSAARRLQRDLPHWQPAGPAMGRAGTRRKPSGEARRSSLRSGTRNRGPRKRPAPPARVRSGWRRSPPASRQSRSGDREASASGSPLRSMRPMQTRPPERRATRTTVCDRPGRAIVAWALRHSWTQAQTRGSDGGSHPRFRRAPLCLLQRHCRGRRHSVSGRSVFSEVVAETRLSPAGGVEVTRPETISRPFRSGGVESGTVTPRQSWSCC